MFKKNMDLKISLKTPPQIADMPLSRMKNTKKTNQTISGNMHPNIK